MSARRFWLFKSEPDVFGIDDLAARAERTEPWDGVRNYQARNFMRDEMRVGDQGFFYHSNCEEPGIVGIVEVASTARADPTALDPDSKYHDPRAAEGENRWVLVDVRFVERFPATVTLARLRTEAALEDMRLLRKGNRLSVMPVDEPHWVHILSIADRD